LPNLLLLCEYATLNGGERSMLATLDAIESAGFSLSVMAPPQGPLADGLKSRGVEVVPFNARDSSGTHRPQKLLREELAGVFQQRRPDLLHANSLSMGRLSGPVAAALNVPGIAHLRDIVRLSAQAATDLNCHRRLLAVSRAVKEYHGGLSQFSSDENGTVPFLDHEKIHVLYNSVDLEQFSPRAATGYLHRELGLDADALLVGTIGQIGLRKGQDVLVRAAMQLADRLPSLHYLIVGERFSDKEESRRFEADLHERLSRNVAQPPPAVPQIGTSGGLSQFQAPLGTAAQPGSAWSDETGTVPLSGARLAKRFHFLGNRDDVARMLNELALLAHPARQEPLGRVLLEAAASGVAVVATDVGGTREIFPPSQQCARLVPPDDAGALAAAILELAADPALREYLGSAARRRAEEAFDIRHAAAAMVEHYRAIITPE
jgi:glycosyltransferase involved in cell wall biosynthesis